MAFPLKEVLEEVAESTRPRFDVRDLPARERPARTPVDVHERFMKRVTKGEGPDACWIWRGAVRFHLAKKGKGGRSKGEAIEFRKFAWEQANGRPAPGKLFAQCRNARCCNPKHLEAKHPGWIPGERKVMNVDARKRKTGAPEIVREAGSVVPIVSGLKWHEDKIVSPPEALTRIVQTLEALAPDGRARVLAAVSAFFEVK